MAKCAVRVEAAILNDQRKIIDAICFGPSNAMLVSSRTNHQAGEPIVNLRSRAVRIDCTAGVRMGMEDQYSAARLSMVKVGDHVAPGIMPWCGPQIHDGGQMQTCQCVVIMCADVI